MRREKIEKDLEEAAFNFFYAFSRFEFALKENRYLRSEQVGKSAEADWERFAKCWETEYKLSKAAEYLIDARPKRQVVGATDLEFRSIDFSKADSELVRVTRLLRVVRNNLFHGSKHGAEGWDDPRRTIHLLTLSSSILDELAEFSGLAADFHQTY